MGRLSGKVAVITGGARGMGEAHARMFAQEGASVALCDVLDDAGAAAARAIEEGGGQARYFHLDVTDPANWAEVVAGVRRWQGRLTTLVNNAGIVNRTGVLDTPVEAWNRILAVNLTGPFLGLQAAAPVMRDAGGGAVVNIASVSAHVGHNDPGYTATKTGLLGLTRTAAMELVGWGIRVNAVCPGIIVTGLNAGGAHLEPWRNATPMGRYGAIEEVSKAVLFLASDDSAYITGEDLAVDGGFLAGGAARRIALEAGVPLPTRADT